MTKANALKVLDILDKARRDESTGYSDYEIRMLCAHIACSVGFVTRNEWIDALMADENTEYGKYYAEWKVGQNR